MAETQRHGFIFENWAKETFFVKGKVNYSHKWDIPKELNTRDIVPEQFRNLPVSVKTSKFTGDIGLGDAIRQYNVNEDFVLIVAYWEQDGANKNFTAIEAVRVTPAQWRGLFDPVTEEQIRFLDRYIKDKSIPHREVQVEAQRIKALDEYLNTKIVLNPKIDSKGQRRLQCTLPTRIFWSEFARKERYSDLNASLWGQAFPNPIESAARIFNRTRVVIE